MKPVQGKLCGRQGAHAARGRAAGRSCTRTPAGTHPRQRGASRQGTCGAMARLAHNSHGELFRQFAPAHRRRRLCSQEEGGQRAWPWLQALTPRPKAGKGAGDLRAPCGWRQPGCMSPLHRFALVSFGLPPKWGEGTDNRNLPGEFLFLSPQTICLREEPDLETSAKFLEAKMWFWNEVRRVW